MSVHGVTDGPLFPDPGPRSARLARRVRSIGLETLLFVLITAAVAACWSRSPRWWTSRAS